jgi:hypothetical protein
MKKDTEKSGSAKYCHILSWFYFLRVKMTLEIQGFLRCFHEKKKQTIAKCHKIKCYYLYWCFLKCNLTYDETYFCLWKSLLLIALRRPSFLVPHVVNIISLFTLHIPFPFLSPDIHSMQNHAAALCLAVNSTDRGHLQSLV